MGFKEDDFIPVSALSHITFCERRAALIHIEQIWNENLFTAEGRNLHKRVDETETEMRGDVLIFRGLYIQSFQYGLTGRTDVVEFYPTQPGDPGVHLSGVPGEWKPFPVEYKRGKSRKEISFEIQLCAQAICLEEMFDISISEGALYFGKSHKRKHVPIDEQLRSSTEHQIRQLRDLVNSGVTPAPVDDKRCRLCSLNDICMPGAVCGKSAEAYMSRMITQSLNET